MDIKKQLALWNKNKWEFKNKAMYEHYHENKWPWYTESLDPDIKKFLLTDKCGTLDILDLGTCSGSQAIELARCGHRLVGTDISETALAQAEQALSEEPGLPVRFLMDDIVDSTLQENQFDLIVDRGCYHSICCFHHEEYIAGVRHLLKTDGVLLLKTMSSNEQRFVEYDKVGGKSIMMPYHFKGQELKDLMSPHFDIQSFEDSFFFSSVIDSPARAWFAVLRNREKTERAL